MVLESRTLGKEAHNTPQRLIILAHILPGTSASEAGQWRTSYPDRHSSLTRPTRRPTMRYDKRQAIGMEITQV
jgi:hypothetical protein